MLTINDDGDELIISDGSVEARNALLKKNLRIIIICVVSASVLGGTIYLAHVHGNKPGQHQEPADLPSKDHNDLGSQANSIKSMMSPGIDPCEDFYKYACGAYDEKFSYKMDLDDPKFVDVFNQADDSLQEKLKGLVTGHSPDTELRSITQAKIYYYACIHSEITDDVFAVLKAKLFLSQFGGWPLASTFWSEASFDLEEILAKTTLILAQSLLSMVVVPDDKNTTRNIIKIDQPPLTLPSRDFYIKNDAASRAIMKNYRKSIKDIAQLMGASTFSVDYEIDEIVALETSIAKASDAEVDRRDIESIYTKLTVSDLSKEVGPNFDYLRYLRIVFSNASVSIGPMEEVVLYNIDYLKKLNSIIATTPKRTIANYIVWRIFHGRAAIFYSPTTLRSLSEHSQLTFGTEAVTDKERWQTCLSNVNAYFGPVISQLYIKSTFEKKNKEVVSEMVDYLKQSLVTMLSQNAWMDAATKNRSLSKVAAMSDKIAYPDYLLDDADLEKQYKEIHMDRKQYFENGEQMITHKLVPDMLKRLRKPSDKRRWASEPTQINAFYNARTNAITIPGAIMVTPFFHHGFPKYLNLGGLGTVVGHELTHGFDDKGRLFDERGNLESWWSAESSFNFRKKSACMVDQYSSYEYTEETEAQYDLFSLDATPQTKTVKLDGARTLGENIADNGGIQVAFMAYKKWLKSSPGHSEPTLPGLTLTDEQLFFLRYAQLWCGPLNYAAYKITVATDEHTVKPYRVRGVLSNSEDFSRAYKCKPGSTYNPVKKCKVW